MESWLGGVSRVAAAGPSGGVLEPGPAGWPAPAEEATPDWLNWCQLIADGNGAR